MIVWPRAPSPAKSQHYRDSRGDSRPRLSSGAKLRNFAATKKPRLEAEADKCPVEMRLAASPTVSTKKGQTPSRQQDLLRFHSLGLDHHKFPHRSLVEELDAPRDLGEESVVFAASNVQSRLHPRAPLADDDRAARHQLSSESLEAKPLCVRVAPIP